MSRFGTERAKLDRNEASKRYISAHRLPVSVPLPRVPRPSPMPAAFLVQLMNAPLPVARDEQASQHYRSAETSDVRRLPVGYRKSVLA